MILCCSPAMKMKICLLGKSIWLYVIKCFFPIRKIHDIEKGWMIILMIQIFGGAGLKGLLIYTCTTNRCTHDVAWLNYSAYPQESFITVQLWSHQNVTNFGVLSRVIERCVHSIISREVAANSDDTMVLKRTIYIFIKYGFNFKFFNDNIMIWYYW
jgi:hypothetical protein